MFTQRPKINIFGTSSKHKILEPAPIVIPKIENVSDDMLNLPAQDADSEDEIVYLPGEKLLLRINKDAKKKRKKEKKLKEKDLKENELIGGEKIDKKLSIIMKKKARIAELKAKLGMIS